MSDVLGILYDARGRVAEGWMKGGYASGSATRDKIIREQSYMRRVTRPGGRAYCAKGAVLSAAADAASR